MNPVITPFKGMSSWVDLKSKPNRDYRLKRWRNLLLTVLTVTTQAFAQQSSQPSGSGTSSQPFLIENLDHLNWMALSNNNSSGFYGVYFKLANDIDASATSDILIWPNGWIAIGYSGTPFKGYFDGQGYSITGLRIINSSSNAVHGFFGIISGATISNLKLNLELDFSNLTSSSRSGGLASKINSSSFVQDVHVTIEHIFPQDANGNYDGNLTLLGGFVGESNSSTFKDCSLIGKPLYMSSYRSGGFVGASTSCVFKRCFADVEIYDIIKVTVTNSQQHSGGFAGFSSLDNFRNCYVVGELNGWYGLYGFAGTNTSASNFDTCYTGIRINEWSWDGSKTFLANPGNLDYGIFKTYNRGIATLNCYADVLNNQGLPSKFYSSVQNITQTNAPLNSATYVGWNFTTIWDWDGITNGGYPFLRSNPPITIASNISTPATSYTLPPSQTIQVLPGVKIEVGTLNLNGSNLVLNANSSSYGQLKFSSLSGSGGIVQENYISSGAHMISSSVASGFTNSSGDESKLYSYNASTGAWNSIGSSIGTPGVGYFANVDPSNNPFISAAGTSNVSGTPNTSNTWTISNALNTAPTSSNTSSSGWNLLGNPYTCGLDFSSVYSNNSSLIENAFYIWDATAGGGAGGYVYYSGGGLSSPIIPPMQAFWVQAKTSQSGSITTTMSADGTVASSPTYYKTRPDNLVLHAALLGDTLISDRMWVAHVSGTTSSFDGAYDAWKMTNGPLMPNIYSYVDAEGIAINALDLNGNQIIPVGFDYVDVGAKFRITLEQVTNGQVYQVYLEDKALQQFHDLNQGDYPFTHQVWTQEEPRFALHVSQSTVGTEESDASPTSLVIYQDGARLMVHWYDSDQANYRLVTVDGKEVSKGAIESGLQSLDAPEVSGVYILELAHPYGVERQKFLVTY
jgi:hypothetical protein